MDTECLSLQTALNTCMFPSKLSWSHVQLLLANISINSQAYSGSSYQISGSLCTLWNVSVSLHLVVGMN